MDEKEIIHHFAVKVNQNNTSLYITLPEHIKEFFRLKKGDLVVLKFIKKEIIMTEEEEKKHKRLENE